MHSSPKRQDKGPSLPIWSSNQCSESQPAGWWTHFYPEPLLARLPCSQVWSHDRALAKEIQTHIMDWALEKHLKGTQFRSFVFSPLLWPWLSNMKFKVTAPISKPWNKKQMLRDKRTQRHHLGILELFTLNLWPAWSSSGWSTIFSLALVLEGSFSTPSTLLPSFSFFLPFIFSFASLRFFLI